jgi:hypothetical protein
MFFIRSRWRRLDRLPKAGGISPTNMLSYRNNNPIDGKPARDWGISPDKPFF